MSDLFSLASQAIKRAILAIPTSLTRCDQVIKLTHSQPEFNQMSLTLEQLRRQHAGVVAKVWLTRVVVYKVDSAGGLNVDADTDPELPDGAPGAERCIGVREALNHVADMLDAYDPRRSGLDFVELSNKAGSVRVSLASGQASRLWFFVGGDGTPRAARVTIWREDAAARWQAPAAPQRTLRQVMPETATIA